MFTSITQAAGEREGMMNRITWMNRPALVKRGVLMLEAHWRNRVEKTDLERWFANNYAHYCAFRTGRDITDNRSTVELQFWRDVIKATERKHGIGNK